MSAGFRKRILTGALYIVLALETGSLLLAEPQNGVSTISPSRQNYAGDEACRPCHSEKALSYNKTAHHLTSQRPTQESILGSFADGKNILKTSNPNLYFQMGAKPDGFYQRAVSTTPPSSASRSERVEVVVGSGRRGQTYLYWKGDQLFQLPVSYWTALATWINSPGYRDGEANFEKRVIPNCLGCHLSYAAAIGSPISSNQYTPESLVLGISCERCHGPGRQHVEAATAKKLAAIINPAKLTRDRQIDVCAQCHGGLRTPMKDPFSYVPGELLDKYFHPDDSGPAPTTDVHGNQVALLQLSRCYQFAPNMTCSTCHDVHQTQRDPVVISERCLTCHHAQACGEFSKLKENILGNCANCHMPVQASNVIISNLNGKQARAMVRNHWIRVYVDSRGAPLPAPASGQTSSSARTPPASPCPHSTPRPPFCLWLGALPGDRPRIPTGPKLLSPLDGILTLRAYSAN